MGWSLGSGQDVLKLGDSRIHLCTAGNDPAGREGSLISEGRDSCKILERGMGTQHGSGTLPLLYRREGTELGHSLWMPVVLWAGIPAYLPPSRGEVRPPAERGKQGEKCDLVNLESKGECGGFGSRAADPRSSMWSG